MLVRKLVGSVAHTRLQIDEDGPRDVAGVVALVVEDILPVTALGCEVLQVTVLTDSMLLTQLLPELASNFVPSATARVICTEGLH